MGRALIEKMSPKIKAVHDALQLQKTLYMKDADSDANDEQIPREVFNHWLTYPDVIKMLDAAGIDTATKFELFDVLGVDMGGELSLEEMVNGLMKLRGPITKTDLVAVRLKVRYTTKMVEEMWKA